jgi:molybdopterin synthase catalytic subunit
MPSPSPSHLFAVTTAPLEPGVLLSTVQGEADLRGGRIGTTGAAVSFLGTVRAENAGRRVWRLEYEAFEPLAVKAFAHIAGEAREAWPAVVLGIHHRVGTLGPGDPSVVIVAASPHRGEAFAACRFAIERIKQIAPIWKREHFDGGDVWIEGATADPDDESARQEAMRRACG